jgi:hypothetical protein
MGKQLSSQSAATKTPTTWIDCAPVRTSSWPAGGYRTLAAIFSLATVSRSENASALRDLIRLMRALLPPAMTTTLPSMRP